jgi:cyanate permease
VVILVADMIGPILIGYIYETTGSYSPGFTGMGIGLLVCAGFAILFNRGPVLPTYVV